jgi:hypothetical protein
VFHFPCGSSQTAGFCECGVPFDVSFLFVIYLFSLCKISASILFLQ